MASEPQWLSIEAVIALNRQIVEASAEPHRLRDSVALHIAVKRPWNIWVYFMDEDFAVLAAALLSAIAGARAFAAGNKRTAYGAAVAFLAANGYEVALGDNRHYAIERLLDFFRGRLGQAGLVEWFRLWISARS